MTRLPLFTALAFSIAVITPSSALPNKEPTVCEYIANAVWRLNRNINGDTVSKQFGAPFVRNYLVQRLHSPPTTSPAPASPSTSQCKMASAFEKCQQPFTRLPYTSPHKGTALQRGLYESHYRWLHYVGILPYKDGFYTVRAVPDHGFYRGGFTTGSEIVSVLDANGLVCAFDSRIYERAYTGYEFRSVMKKVGAAVDTNFCQHLVSAEDSIIRPDAEIPLDAWGKLSTELPSRASDYYPSTPWNESTRTRDPNSAVRIDFDGDGEIETLLRVNYSPSSGWCDYHYFDAITEGMSAFADDETRGKLLRLQGADVSKARRDGTSYPCFSKTTIRKYAARYFFEVSGVSPPDSEDEFGDYQQGDSGILTRKVFTWIDDRPFEVCESKFSVRPMIVYDRSKDEPGGAED